MGFLSFFKGADINAGVKQYNETPGAYLIDVREPGEYSQGHVPGSKNHACICILSFRRKEFSGCQ